MAKRFAIIITILVVIFGGTFALHLIRTIATKRFFTHFQQPPVTVSTTYAKKQTWNPRLQSVGTLKAVNGVEVNSEVTGQVVRIYFSSGQTVKKGAPLIQLDDSVDQQTLNNTIAQLRLDRVNYERQVKLYKTRATAKSALDEALAKKLQSKAAVVTAEVMIAKKKIKAPFSGKLGIRQVDVGQYIKPGQAMVPLQSLDPLFVNFNLPQQYLKIVRVGQAVRITTDAIKGREFEGRLTAINSIVDVNTRTIFLQATIPNKELALYPGLFADVNVILPARIGVITVPQTAITYSLYGDSVYVVTRHKNKKGKIELIANQQFITVGERRGTVVAIEKGLKTGDQVVTSGQLKLHRGSHVIINNTIKLN